jgi:xanthine dehydrogenase YagS FAD-binding subunit
MNKVTVINATSLDEAVSALGSNAAVLAGGTDILNALKAFIYPNPPDTLVNIKTISGLDYIEEDGGMLKIGALTKLADIAESSVVNGKWSSLAQAALSVGMPQLRHMGTIAGNLVQDCRCWYYRAEQMGFNCFRKGGTLCFLTAGNNDKHSAILGGQVCFTNSVSDTANPLVALDATIVTTKRSIPAGDLLVVLGDILDDDEIITEIQVPTPASDTKQVYLKWAERKAIDFAEVSVATAISSSDAKIVLGGVAPTPWRATGAEAALPDADAAAEAAVDGAFPLPANGTGNQGNAYKIQLTKAMVKRALQA